MKIGICDDERELRLAMKKVVERELQLAGVDYEIDEYDSAESLLREVDSEELSILFLDIEMSGMSGMEAARELRRHSCRTVIIFVTAYPDFVFQGYEVRAFHYILKPYKEEKIKEVLHMALEETGTLKERFYIVEQKSGTLKIPLKDICYFKSDRKRIEAVMEDKTEVFYGRLSDVETELPDYFARCHNRYLVNLNFVTKLAGNTCICGGEELPVSRGYKQELSVAFARAWLH